MVWLGAIVVLAALQLALIVTHEPWADEHQALLIAAQAPNLATLLEWLTYEGHPPLWYLLLRGLDAVLTALDTLWVAALGCAVIAQGIILFASPFARHLRLLIASSQFVLFEFLTVSRGTTLGAALVFVALAAWTRRIFWLVLAILPLVDFLFGVISGILLLLKWRERDLWWPGVGLWLIGGLAAAWTVIPAPDMVPAYAMIPLDTGWLQWFDKLSGVALPFQGGIAPQWNAPVQPVGSVAWIGFIALCWVQTRRNPTHLLLMFGFLAFTFVFSLAFYPISLRHMMLAALVLIALVWREAIDGTAPSRWFLLWLGLAAIASVVTSAAVFTKSFDTAGKAIAEIEQRGLDGEHWIAFPDWRIPALSARSGMRFERPEQHCMLQFVRWDHRTGIYDPEKLEAFLIAEIERHGRAYLVSDRALDAVSDGVLKPLSKVDAGYNGIPYYLYEVGPKTASREVVLPDCVGGAKPLDHWQTGALGKK